MLNKIAYWIGLLLLFSFVSCGQSNSTNEEVFSVEKEAQYSIEPESLGWGDANVSDVKAVTSSVASIILSQFPKKTLNPIILKNRKEGPRVLYERGKNNEYIIFVDIAGRYWAQLSYQFSHELGHILSNYANESGKNQWFEETIGEVLSLYTLDKMSIEWKNNPPYESWRSYSRALKEYLDYMLQEKHRTINIDLATWYTTHENSLRNDPYIREKNEVVATAIYYLIKEKKFQISSIQYLNLGIPNENKSFSTYLKEWYENSEKEDKESVLNVIELLGVAI